MEFLYMFGVIIALKSFCECGKDCDFSELSGYAVFADGMFIAGALFGGAWHYIVSLVLIIAYYILYRKFIRAINPCSSCRSKDCFDLNIFAVFTSACCFIMSAIRWWEVAK